MERFARWNDASLLPERGLSLSPAVDASLRVRIRSLLDSRNEKRLPKTHCPSPGINLSLRDPEENQPKQQPFQAKVYSPVYDQAKEQSTLLELASLDMGATRFDGPAGQVGRYSDDFARRPSQPDLPGDRKSSGDWLWSATASALNQRAHGDILGRETSMPAPLDRRKSSGSKKSTSSRIPRYHLRTVPPAKDVNKILCPNPLHVPGSYQTEPRTSKDRDLPTVPTFDDSMDEREGGVLAVPYHSGLSKEHAHQAAADALRDVVKHDHHQAHESASFHSVPSPETPKSQAAIDKPEGLPQEMPIKHEAVSNEIIKPLLSCLQESDTRPGDVLNTPIFVVGDDLDDGLEPSHNVALHYEQDREMEPAKSVSGPQVSELLAELPPLRQAPQHDLVAQGTRIEPGEDTPTAPFKKYPSMISSFCSVDIDEDATSPDLPSSDPVTEAVVPTAEANDKDETKMPLIPDSRKSSVNTSRLSSVSRAMSIVSELSSRSKIKTPSFRPSSKYRKIDSHTNLTTRPRSRTRIDGPGISNSQDPCESSLVIDQRHGPRTSDSKDIALEIQHGSTNGLTKVITDLESVLTEALDIAGQSAVKKAKQAESHHSPARRQSYHRVELAPSTDSSECCSSLSEKIDEEENLTTLAEHNFSKHQGPSIIEVRTHQTAQMPPQTRYTSDTVSNFLEVPRPSSSMTTAEDTYLRHRSFNSKDWAVIRVPSQPSKLRLEVKPPPTIPGSPPILRAPNKEQHSLLVRNHRGSEDTATREKIREYVNARQRPPVQARLSSRRLREKESRGRAPRQEELNLPDEKSDDDDLSDCDCVPYVADFGTSRLQYHPMSRDAANDEPRPGPRQGPLPFRPPQDTLSPLRDNGQRQATNRNDEPPPAMNTYSLEGRHHFSVREPRGFSLIRSHKRSPIARDWSVSRKRYTATVACITTAFIGLVIGIYAGEVPAIQYAIADEHHYTILGNVFFFIGLAITTALFYPLPLLHGRKPYTLAALAILLPLQFPQALAIDMSRSPYVATYRVGLLVPRIFAGIVMGFANINLFATLLDLYGASLQSGNPHQEVVNENDVRRHGGGMGVWLSIWTWCAIGSIGLGFFIGAVIISGLNVSWGFWILIILNAAILVLNILTPEVRRSAYRRSMAEVRSGGEVSRRVARGEIKMHLESTGPIWFWEELIAGHVLAFRMLIQPGFAILALYQGWIYGQVVLTIVVCQSRRLSCTNSHASSCLGLSCRSTIVSTLNTWDWQWRLSPLALCWRYLSRKRLCSVEQDTILKGLIA